MEDIVFKTYQPQISAEPQYAQRIFIGMNKKKKVHRVVRHTFFL